MTSPILVRAGLPLTDGTLVEYAKARGLPVLMSANAFAKRAPRDHPEGRRFEGFKQNLSALDGMDIALDSAGYVATRLYGDYEWTAEAYLAGHVHEVAGASHRVDRQSGLGRGSARRVPHGPQHGNPNRLPGALAGTTGS